MAIMLSFYTQRTHTHTDIPFT